MGETDSKLDVEKVFSSPWWLAKDHISTSCCRLCRMFLCTLWAAEQLFKMAQKVNNLIVTAGIVLVLTLNLRWVCKYCVAMLALTGADYSHVNISLRGQETKDNKLV
jgi:hypothetical protein